MNSSHFDALRNMKAHRPFVPFRIRTTSGATLEVQGRFQFAVGPVRAMYFYPATDRFIELTEGQIAAIESIAQRPAA
jgi:hypothetical protein